jgi:hypothetical protein
MQIKVQNTRMHKPTSAYGWKITFEVPVADAQLIILSTQESKWWDTCLPSERAQVIQPILISLTEKIGRNELFYRNDTHEILQNDFIPHSDNYYDGCFKVLALREHFSPKHLQAILDGKMKEGDKVLVECTLLQDNGVDKYGEATIIGVEIIKLNSSNHITLHKIEEKMYTREEVKDAALFTFGKDYLSITENNRLNKWFEQNVK